MMFLKRRGFVCLLNTQISVRLNRYSSIWAADNHREYVNWNKKIGNLAFISFNLEDRVYRKQEGPKQG